MILIINQLWGHILKIMLLNWLLRSQQISKKMFSNLGARTCDMDLASINKLRMASGSDTLDGLPGNISGTELAEFSFGSFAGTPE